MLENPILRSTKTPYNLHSLSSPLYNLVNSKKSFKCRWVIKNIRELKNLYCFENLNNQNFLHSFFH